MYIAIHLPTALSLHQDGGPAAMLQHLKSNQGIGWITENLLSPWKRKLDEPAKKAKEAENKAAKEAKKEAEEAEKEEKKAAKRAEKEAKEAEKKRKNEKGEAKKSAKKPKQSAYVTQCSHLPACLHTQPLSPLPG